jgi:hypothetical protein
MHTSFTERGGVEQALAGFHRSPGVVVAAVTNANGLGGLATAFPSH